MSVRVTDHTLYVACASGTLVHMTEAGEPIDRLVIEPDLRDVMLVDGLPQMSLFRSAELIDEAREVMDRRQTSTPGQQALFE